MTWDFSEFHFIRPLWLIAIPLLFVLWLLMTRALKTTHWEAHLNKRILEALRVNSSKQSNIGRWLLLSGWAIAALAVAGPTWQKQAVPSFQNSNAMVVVLDLSISMLTDDLSPNRLTQAKYKLIDILRARQDGQTALVAYSGDAHSVTPLTDDPNAIEALLPALHPNIMPSKGSNTEAAIELATKMLSDNGSASGEILLITDGVTDSAQQTILASLDNSYRLSILGVGETDASPIPLEGGGFLRSSSGEIILSALNNQQLSQFAQQANGRYSQISTNDNDIDYLISDEFDARTDQSFLSADGDSTLYDSWEDMGHWLVLLLLPLAVLCFRKGVLYVLPLFFILPPDSNALEWQDLWLTQDQQAQKLLKENPNAAAEKFKREDWAGVASYQANDYSAAAEKFATMDNEPESNYNRGNALALSGDLEGAIDAYEKAIDLQSDYQDAIYNKQLVEQILEQKQQQEQQQNQEQSGENSEQSDSDNSEQQGQESQRSEESQPSQESESSEESESSQEADSQDSAEQNSQNDAQEQSSEQQASEQEAQESSEQNDGDANEQQAQQAELTEQDSEQDGSEEESTAMFAEATPEQLQDASEQWLRTIQDDPSGLLRRKFEYESWLNSQSKTTSQRSNNNPSDERY